MQSFRLDRRKVRARKRKLRNQLEEYRSFLPHVPDWTVHDFSIRPYGWVLPLLPPLLDKLANDRGWDRRQLAALASQPRWLYCPDLDVFLRWDGSCFVCIDRQGPDALSVTG
mgnify:CR=1 FL=1